jgi:hypothetical protein
MYTAPAAVASDAMSDAIYQVSLLADLMQGDCDGTLAASLDERVAH